MGTKLLKKSFPINVLSSGDVRDGNRELFFLLRVEANRHFSINE